MQQTSKFVVTRGRYIGEYKCFHGIHVKGAMSSFVLLHFKFIELLCYFPFALCFFELKKTSVQFTMINNLSMQREPLVLWQARAQSFSGTYSYINVGSGINSYEMTYNERC